MSKTGKGCQAVPSWFSIPLGPPVRAWGSTGRLAGRFCRAAAHTTQPSAMARSANTARTLDTTHRPNLDASQGCKSKIPANHLSTCSDKRVWDNAWAVCVDQNNYKDPAWCPSIHFSIQTSWIDADIQNILWVSGCSESNIHFKWQNDLALL